MLEHLVEHTWPPVAGSTPSACALPTSAFNGSATDNGEGSP